MSYAYRRDDAWVELPVGGFILGDGDDAIQYPANWLALSTPEDREPLGIVEITEPADPAPTDVKLIGTRLVDTNGVPVREYVTEPFTEAELAAQAAIAKRVPESVTRYQFKSILAQTPAIEGSNYTTLFEQVEAFVNSPAAPAIVRIAWTEADRFQRASQFWPWAVQALGVPAEQVEAMLDDLFRLAETVKG